jgi:transposase InsO family protein
MPTPTNDSLKRGWPAQRSRREAEAHSRRHAVAFDRWAGDLGLSHTAAARSLDLAPGTLADWQHRSQDDDLAPQPLGRPCQRSAPAARNAAIDLMRIVGPRIGLPALQTTFPDMPRAELQNLQLRFRRHSQRDNQRLLHVLHWHSPGAVWAMDHAEPPSPIDGRWPCLFSVRDLASGCQLAWLPVPDATALSTIHALKTLFLQFGPPLVLKCDNGSAFTADDTRLFLDRSNVLPLFSPPYTPSYNGACEAGIGALKTRTHHIAALADRPGLWTADDIEAARRMANELNYPNGSNSATPDQLWTARSPMTNEDRAAFGRTVLRHRVIAREEQQDPLDTDLDFQAQASLDRTAIRRALVELGFLTFTRRSITPQLPPQKTPRIS